MTRGSPLLLVDHLAVVGRDQHLVLQLLGTGDHRAELEHVEQAPVLADALLPEEGGPGRVQPDQEGDDGHRAVRPGAARLEPTTRSKARLTARSIALDHRLAQPDQRDAADDLSPGADERHRVVVGCDLHAHRELLDHRHELVQPFVGARREGNPDLLDLPRLNGCAGGHPEIPGPAPWPISSPALAGSSSRNPTRSKPQRLWSRIKLGQVLAEIPRRRQSGSGFASPAVPCGRSCSTRGARPGSQAGAPAPAPRRSRTAGGTCRGS